MEPRSRARAGLADERMCAREPESIHLGPEDRYCRLIGRDHVVENRIVTSPTAL